MHLRSKGNAKGLKGSKPLDIVGVCKISDVFGGHEVKGFLYGKDGLS